MELEEKDIFICLSMYSNGDPLASSGTARCADSYAGTLLLSTSFLEAVTEHLVHAVPLDCLTVLGPWECCLTFLPFNFLIYKMK